MEPEQDLAVSLSLKTAQHLAIFDAKNMKDLLRNLHQDRFDHPRLAALARAWHRNMDGEASRTMAMRRTHARHHGLGVPEPAEVRHCIEESARMMRTLASPLRLLRWSHHDLDNEYGVTLRHGKVKLFSSWKGGDDGTTRARGTYRIIERHPHRMLVALRLAQIKTWDKSGASVGTRVAAFGPHRVPRLGVGVWQKVWLSSRCVEGKPVRSLCVPDEPMKKCWTFPEISKDLAASVITANGKPHSEPTCEEVALWERAP